MTAKHEDRAFRSRQMTGVSAVDVPVDGQAATARLSKAITYRTVSNQDRSDFDEAAFTGFHDHLAESFPKVHETLTRELLGDPRSFSLLYTWEGSDPSLAPVVLMGHQDVVPVVPGTERDWEHDAFSGDIADGYIWGRGSLDDKIMVLAILEAVEMHLAAGFQPKRTVHLAFGQDEEVMGGEGIRNVVDTLRQRGVDEVAFVLDEGVALTTGLFPGIDAPLALIGTAEKGYASLELKVTGPGGHSAMPPEHSNIGILAQAITRVESSPFPYRVTQAVRDQFRFLGPELPKEQQSLLQDVVFGPEPGSSRHKGTDHASPEGPTAGWHVASESEDRFISFMRTNPQTAAMLHTTTAVTMVDGGVKENVLPPSASAVVNFRILQEETVDSVVERVKTLIADDRVEVSVLASAIDPSPVSDPDGPGYRIMERSIRQTWNPAGLLVCPYLVIGGADAKWFAPIAKSVFRFTAVRIESAADSARWHGVNERVLAVEYPRSIAFFHNLITNLQEL